MIIMSKKEHWTFTSYFNKLALPLAIILDYILLPNMQKHVRNTA